MSLYKHWRELIEFETDDGLINISVRSKEIDNWIQSQDYSRWRIVSIIWLTDQTWYRIDPKLYTILSLKFTQI
jgi:hypothetical protein